MNLDKLRDEMAAERFFSYVKYSNSCWIWNGTKNDKDYGVFRLSNPRRQIYAHRWSYEYFIGPLGNLFCCHHCDVPSCVNPFHLFGGTNSDNVRDSVEKGIHSKAKMTSCINGHSFSGNKFRMAYRSNRDNEMRLCLVCCLIRKSKSQTKYKYTPFREFRKTREYAKCEAKALEFYRKKHQRQMAHQID